VIFGRRVVYFRYRYNLKEPPIITVRIVSSGSAVPDKIITNQDLESRIDTTDEWIQSRTGIRQRHISQPGESASDLAHRACQNMLAEDARALDGVELILAATTTPDYPVFPTVSALLGHRLSLGTIPCVDISAACTGFIYALSAACAYLKSGIYSRVLLVCVDTLSHFLDWEDRRTCILFGDGAGALVLESVQSGTSAVTSDILAFDLHADGAGKDLLIVPEGGSRSPLSGTTWANKGHFVQMDGPAVYKFAINVICESMTASLAACGLTIADLDHFVPHQANIRIIDSACKRLGIDANKVRTNLERYGNTSAASIPLLLDEMRRGGSLKRNDIVAAVGFGAGLTWGSAIIRW
jgi:3-oxoacyl-[acyl-carrier-protein] synthase III